MAQDNDFGTWNAYGNQYWPAKYLIDADGQVRYVHFGEGEYETTVRAIRTLLHEAGGGELGGAAQARVEKASPGVTTPETYFGAARAQGFVNGPLRPGRQDFGRRRYSLLPDQLAYGGRWLIDAEEATASTGATLDLDFGAAKVFLVLGCADGRPRSLRVELDGRPIPNRLAGDDVSGGVARISDQRLYRLVDLPSAGRHRLRLSFEPGISGYAFTFG